MSDARRRRDASPGLLSALLGVALLVVVGFGLGVVAGLLVEEPDLVLDYAAGNTEAVPLDAAGGETAVSTAPGEEAAEPASAGAEGSAATAPAPADAASASPADRPPAGRSAAAAPGFSVQVGAFGESAAAQGLADRLRSSGYDVYVSPSPPERGPRRWRVRVGPVASRPQAERLAKRLQAESLPTWVLAEDAG